MTCKNDDRNSEPAVDDRLLAVARRELAEFFDLRSDERVVVLTDTFDEQEQRSQIAIALHAAARDSAKSELTRFEPLNQAVDVAVFATPVYFGDLSESLRAFLDRLRRITRHESAKRGIENKPAIGICVAGGGGGGAPSCAVSLEKILTTCGFDLLDIVPVRRQNLEMKLAVLREIGQWLARRP